MRGRNLRRGFLCGEPGELTVQLPYKRPYALAPLFAQGLVEHDRYRGQQLTREGRKVALELVRHHRLLEMFLVRVLGYSWDEVHEEAENMEHAVSDMLIDRIDEYLGRPATDPHGDPIPSADGEMRVRVDRAVPLSTVAAGMLLYEAVRQRG